MANERIAVVFDTNSYRNLILHTPIDQVEAYVKQLREKEAKKNIRATGTPVVGMEMLANLAGPGKSLHYEDCLKGVIAMANHCCNELEKVIHIIPHAYFHLALNFFEVMPPAIEGWNKNMAGIIGDFKIDYAKAAEYHEMSGTFRDLKNYIDQDEALWVNRVTSLIEGARHEVLKKHPAIARKHLQEKLLAYIDSGDFIPFVSMEIIFTVAGSLGIRMTEQEHVMKGYSLPQVFPFSVAFYYWICHRIVADNIDMQSKISRGSRWNWRWDYEVSFLINDLPLGDRQVLLVTADGDLTKMLHKFGYSGKVMNLPEYLKFLDS